MEKINIFSVAVVLPDFIERFLDTLEGNTEPNYEVILVDNSRDGIERIVQRRVSCILRPGYNLSFAKSHNTALRLATTTT